MLKTLMTTENNALVASEEELCGVAVVLREHPLRRGRHHHTVEAAPDSAEHRDSSGTYWERAWLSYQVISGLVWQQYCDILEIEPPSLMDICSYPSTLLHATSPKEQCRIVRGHCYDAWVSCVSADGQQHAGLRERTT